MTFNLGNPMNIKDKSEDSKDIDKENINADLHLITNRSKVVNLNKEELISNIVELKLLDYLGVSINLSECILCGSEDIYTLDINADEELISKYVENNPIFNYLIRIPRYPPKCIDNSYKNNYSY